VLTEGVKPHLEANVAILHIYDRLYSTMVVLSGLLIPLTRIAIIDVVKDALRQKAVSLIALAEQSLLTNFCCRERLIGW